MASTRQSIENDSTHQVTVVDEPSSNPPSWFKNLIKNQSPTSDPRNWPIRKKTFIVLIVAFAGCTSPLASSIYYPALVPMQKYFETTDTVINASLAIYIFCLALFPLIWASFADVYGRRPIYLISFLLAIAGMVCSAVSVNIVMFIVFRAFSAVGSSSVLSMGAGTIGDIFETHQRGRAYSLYLTGPMFGPAIGPVIGGYLNSGLGWRSIFWFLAILCLIIWIGVVFLLPETLYLEAKETIPQGNEKQKKRRFINPVAALDLLRNINITLTVLFLGTLFFVYFVLNANFTRIYTEQYGFDSGMVGLFYLPIAGGGILSGMVGGRLSDQLYRRRVAKLPEGVKPTPELRIGGVILYASILLMLLAYTAFGWCVQYNLHFAYGIVCVFFIGLATAPPNIIMSTYLVDCFRERSASVTACNNFTRYVLSGVGSLVASDMQRVMGPGGLYTFCGGLIFVMAGVIVVVRIKGREWAERRNS